MLVEITKVPSAENSAIHLHPTDNVAVARVPVPAGAELLIEGLPVTHRATPFPRATKSRSGTSRAGEIVERYGQVIGRAQVADRRGPPHPHAQPGVRGTRARLRISHRRDADSGRAPPSPPSRAICARTGASARATISRWWRPATARRTPRS